MTSKNNIYFKTAIALAVAVAFVSCSGKLKGTGNVNMSETPVQAIRDMFAVQTTNGQVMQRLEAPLMQRFERDTVQFESFPEGFALYAYTEDGLLETIILADEARHIVGQKNSDRDIWEAYGNVFVHNTIKSQSMETDTLYWDRKGKEIWTDSYVKMYSQDGLMQGYGMRSDERARNSILLDPFDSYSYTQQDTTKVLIDSANFIGPLLKK